MENKEMPQPEELLEGLKQGHTDAIKIVYNLAYGSCANMVLKNSGSKDDARDIFQEALIVLFRKLRKPDFVLTCSIKTFLYAVTRNLWLKKLRQRKSMSLDLVLDDPNINYNLVAIDDLDEKRKIEEKHEHIAKVLGEFKEDCRRLLLAFYFKKMPLKEIAKLMDYSESFVKVKKKRCMDSLKKKVLETYKTSEIP